MLSNPSEIYGILNPETCNDPEQHLRFLIGLKLPVVQIRAKNLPLWEVRRLVDRLLSIRNAMGETTPKIIINDSTDIALEGKVDGVHLGQGDLKGVDLVQLRLKLGPNAIIGVSTHNKQQAELADRSPVTYMAVGPIFPSPTKSGHAEIIGLDGLKTIAAAVTKSIVAIGGITLEKRQLVIDAGASQVALISALEELGKRSQIK